MKKLVILSFLIHASIICSSSSSDENVKYTGPKILIDLINKATGDIPKEKYKEIYEGCCDDDDNCYQKLLQNSMEQLFNLGKTYLAKEINTLKLKKYKYKTDFYNKSLIQCLNSYSTPAKIGVGIVGAIVIASLAYSGRQFYLFGTQKYSNWKAKKEESES